MSLVFVIIGVTVLVSIYSFSKLDVLFKLSLSPFSMVRNNEWWRFITHGLVHVNYTHLLINMLVFWSFGGNVVRIFGALEEQGIISGSQFWFLGLYLGALIFSSSRDFSRERENVMFNSVGASGAVSAMVFTSIFFAPWSKIYFMAIVPIPAVVFGGVYLWYENRLSGRKSGSVNHTAHIYGAIFGLLFPLLMDPKLLLHFMSELMNFRF